MSSGPDIPDRMESELNIKAKLTGRQALKGSLNDLAGDLAEPAKVLATGGTKSQAAWAAVAVTMARVLGPLGLISGAVFGVLAAMKLVVGQSRLLADGLRVAASLEMKESQFRPLLGGIAQAKERVKELFQFAASTPFQIGGITEASRLLEVLTGGALSTGRGLRMVGDAAAVAGRPLEEVAMWVGRLYDQLKSGGQAIGQETMRLQQMGLVTGQARREIEELTASGADFATVWRRVERELARSQGGMEMLSQTMGGLQSTLQDVRDAFAAAFAGPFLEAEKDAIRSSIKLTEALTPVVGWLGQILAVARAPFDAIRNAVLQSDGALKVLTTSLQAGISAMVVFGGTVAVVQLRTAIVATIAFTRAILAKAAATKVSTAATLENTVATNLNTWATGKGAVAKTAATVATKGLSLALGALKGTLGLVVTAARAAWAALIANPLLAIGTAVVGLSALLALKAREEANALRELRDANREVEDSISSKLRAMRSEADQQANLITITNKLADAYRKLREMREGGASFAAVKDQQRHIAVLESQRSRASNQSGLVPTGQTLEEVRARLVLEDRIASIILQGELSRLSSAEKAVRLTEERAKLEERIAAAEAAKTSGEQSSAIRERNMSEGQAINEQISALIAEANNLAQGDGKSRGANTQFGAGDSIADIQRQAQVRRAAIAEEISLLQRRRAEILAQNRALPVGASAATALDIENLDQLRAKQAELNQQLDTAAHHAAEAFRDEEARLSIREHLAIAAEATARGDYQAADAAAREARELERQLELRRRIRELTGQGISPDEAARIATAEADSDRRSEQAKTAEFQRKQNAEIGILETSASGDWRRARTGKDHARYEELLQEALAAGVPAEQAESLARRRQNAEIEAEEQGKGYNIKADSLQRLALGGYASGTDPAQRSRQRMIDLTEKIHETLKAIAQEEAPF